MFNTKKLVTLAVLAALGIPLMLIEVPTFTPWLKFDISDVVVYLAAIIYGPMSAVLVAFVKSIIHFFVKGSPIAIPLDQFIAFLSSLSYALPLYYMTRLMTKKFRFNNHNVVSRLIPVVVSTLAMTLIMVTLNYLFLTEWYLTLLLKNYGVTDLMGYIVAPAPNGLGFSVPSFIENSELLPKDTYFWFIFITYAPFNLLKAISLSALFMVLSYRLDYLVKRFNICEDDVCPIIINEELESN